MDKAIAFPFTTLATQRWCLCRCTNIYINESNFFSIPLYTSQLTCLFLFACLLSLSLFSFYAHLHTRFFSFSLFVRSFVVSERYCDKYLSRRRATLIRNKSKKPIVYLSFSSFDCLLTVCLHYINITTITNDNKQNKQKKNNNNNPPTLLF